MVKKHWWKALGVLILLYVFTAGLLVPLKTGIVQVGPQKLSTGQEAVLEVTGYNSFYAQAGDQLRAWLKLDEARALAARSIEVIDDRHLKISFSIPAFLPSRSKSQEMALVIDSPVDGAHVLPSAVFIVQDSISFAAGEAHWQNSDIAQLHEREGITFPFRNILAETIRNTYFHVPLWFAMIFIFLGGVFYSVRQLRFHRIQDDLMAAAYTRVGILFGILGLVTGAIWAKNTWGAYWSGDIKQNMTAIALLIYFAYFILRNSFEDPEKRARIVAVYNLFAFAAMIPLIYVIPRLTDSLHPGSGGNPALGGEDLDNTMRMVFYPAILGWTLLGLWITNILARIQLLWEQKWDTFD